MPFLTKRLTNRPRPRAAPRSASGRSSAPAASPAVGWIGDNRSLAGPMLDLMPVDDSLDQWLIGGAQAAPLTEVEDRRTYWPMEYPTSWEPARNRSGAFARLQATPLQAPRRKSIGGAFPRLVEPSFGVSFRHPRSVLVCVRRKTRREVLLAKRHGGGRHRPARLNEYSHVRC